MSATSPVAVRGIDQGTPPSRSARGWHCLGLAHGWMGPLLYFGFAVVWVGAGITASAVSFRMVLQSERLQHD